jgi:hypothetical protein
MLPSAQEIGELEVHHPGFVLLGKHGNFFGVM